MIRVLRASLLIALILAPIIFYKTLNKKNTNRDIVLPIVNRHVNPHKPKIALIFDDLGESLGDLKEIYSLDIPLSISVIPGLKFSKNIAHIGSRCGFSVLIHLPMEAKDGEKFKTDKYQIINSLLTKREVESLLRYYLNAIRIAIGVNNHMGSAATENPELMRIVIQEIKKKNLIFIDSRTSLSSVAYDIAKNENLICGYSAGFLDSIDDVAVIKEKLQELVKKAKQNGKIIVIAHPKKNTFIALKDKLPSLKQEIEIITLKDYVNLDISIE